MPRKAREKSDEAVYHIMGRSPSEILLFRDDDDKEYFLDLIKRYTDRYKCSVYGYCLMDTHYHFHLDPKGFDISTFMKCLNNAYAWYYNHKYQRHGAVFQGRFESRILSTDEYNLTVSAYIHNNPHDIEEYNGKEEAYKYSSYGIYLGIRKDIRKLVDKSFIMGLFNARDEKIFAKRYREFACHQRETGNLGKLKKELSSSVENEYISGRKIILRNYIPAKVISFISNKVLNLEKSTTLAQPRQKLRSSRAFTAYALRVLCGLSYNEICNNIYNVTISGCSKLCISGYELLNKVPAYKGIFDELLNCKA